MTHSDWRRAKLGFTLIGENLLLHVSNWIASRLSSGDLIFFFFCFYRASQTSPEHLLMYCGETRESMTLCRLTQWTYKELDSLKTHFSVFTLPVICPDKACNRNILSFVIFLNILTMSQLIVFSNILKMFTIK